jgi:hypothetical protein
MCDKFVCDAVEVLVPPAAHGARLWVERHPAVDVVVAFAAHLLPAGQPVALLVGRTGAFEQNQ